MWYCTIYAFHGKLVKLDLGLQQEVLGKTYACRQPFLEFFTQYNEAKYTIYQPEF